MLPFCEITLKDKRAVEACGAHYNYHLCERCFVDLLCGVVIMARRSASATVFCWSR